jgi:catechol 2,3-dioxygenase-like lactoylglutathione lyase family enzyme
VAAARRVVFCSALAQSSSGRSRRRCCGGCSWGQKDRIRGGTDGHRERPLHRRGWNRFQLEVADLAATVETLRRHGARFRNDIVVGVGGKQILLEDPSGNPIELFEPILPEASMSPHR